MKSTPQWFLSASSTIRKRLDNVFPHRPVLSDTLNFRSSYSPSIDRPSPSALDTRILGQLGPPFTSGILTESGANLLFSLLSSYEGYVLYAI